MRPSQLKINIDFDGEKIIHQKTNPKGAKRIFNEVIKKLR